MGGRRWLVEIEAQGEGGKVGVWEGLGRVGGRLGWIRGGVGTDASRKKGGGKLDLWAGHGMTGRERERGSRALRFFFSGWKSSTGGSPQNWGIRFRSDFDPRPDPDPISIRFRSDYDPILIRFRSDFDPIRIREPIPIRFRSANRFRSDFDPISIRLRSDFDPIPIRSDSDPISIRFRSDFDPISIRFRSVVSTGGHFRFRVLFFVPKSVWTVQLRMHRQSSPRSNRPLPNWTSPHATPKTPDPPLPYREGEPPPTLR